MIGSTSSYSRSIYMKSFAKVAGEDELTEGFTGSANNE
jgi:hypothetical protein